MVFSESCASTNKSLHVHFMVKLGVLLFEWVIRR